MTKLTTHAKKRMQQRGVPPLVVEWLKQYGQKLHDHHGAMIFYFDKRARKTLQHVVGKLVTDRLEDFLDAYIVICDDTIITTGFRYKRLP